MKELEVWYVDAFATQAFGGNPAAVVFCDSAPATATMQAIAREVNLSETVFILPKGDESADYKARIFTVRREIPFAGHPSLAAAAAFAQKHERFRPGVWPVLRQECGIGIVTIETAERPYGVALFVRQRPAQHSDAGGVEVPDVARALGCPGSQIAASPIEVVSTGVPWLIIELRSLGTIRTLQPDSPALVHLTKSVGAVGLTAFCRDTSSPDCFARLRSFAPAEGISEDPVCGSCHGSVAAYLLKHSLKKIDPHVDEVSFLMEQGEELFRPGFAEVIVRRNGDDTQLLVGGASVTTLKGKILF